jgi:ADP-ribose pyrophosphatase YjhB (NUDIX family)
MALFEKRRNMQIGKYPEAMYRVSLKAIIRNEAGEVLVVKEKGSQWSLPGGGIDHGEYVEVALKRELFEEVLLEASFSSRLIGIDSFYIEDKQRWQMWLVHEITVGGHYEYGLGADADEVAFIDPTGFKDSPHRPEKLVYKWCVEHPAKSM